METKEYRTIDKSSWARGEWDQEPDKRQWRDEATELPCLIVRGPIGALCGYVGVPTSHPLHGKDHHEVYFLPAHGGVTFAGDCGHGEESSGICHVPGGVDPDDVHWFGFDCAHAWDYIPAIKSYPLGELIGGTRIEYRNVDYVTRECQALALALKGIGEG